MSRIAVLLLAAALCATARSTAQSGERPPALLAPAPTPSGAPPAVPAEDFRELCGGHIAAVRRPDGRPGPHLVWKAYSSPTAADTLAERYADELAGGTREADDKCHLWRFEDGAKHIWDLCPADVPGPTSECDPPPAGTRSILIVSSMVGSD